MALPKNNFNINDDENISGEDISKGTISASKKENKKPKQKRKNKKEKTNDVKLEKSNKWIVWLIGILAILLVAGVGTGIVLVNKSNSEENSNSDEKGTSSVGVDNGSDASSNANSEGKDGDIITNEETDASGEEYKEETPWNLLPVEDAHIDVRVLEDESYKNISKSSASLPSEDAGYVSDLDQMNLEDGTYNPMFSYLTQESFAKDLTIIIESLTNPYFGGWLDVFESGDISKFNKDFLSDFYDTKALEKTDVSDLPLLIDKNGKGFGIVDEFDTKVNAITNNFNFDDGDNIKINSVADITISGVDSKGKTVKKNVSLELSLSQNPDGEDYPRILVQSGKITVV